MLDSFIYVSDLIGVITCAISGVLVATRLRMDPFGIIVLAGVTGIGGGTLRDMMMGATPVFWIVDNMYIYVIIITAILSLIWLHRIHRFPAYLLPIFDAFGLAIFTINGAQKALMLGFSWPVAIVMGCITGVVGGMIRDILSGQIPFVLQKEIYATASILGATLYVLCDYIELGPIFSMAVAMLGTLSLRLCAIYYHLSLPVFSNDREA
ncbi:MULTISPECIES: trimeric intracellular cation channel family protein [Psychromonas]|uniref:trimeric intracellular cation channel family protein n=1 Tax=Psychromonas TaxID=67572 RepID=UPI000410ACEA|nr:MULTISPECIES: trimeric intracellular cation channel family protein [Psychromonas]MBB1271878.1 trimeric intracellular cation channel family protein [Psychromonas sp. SR45-3]